MSNLSKIPSTSRYAVRYPFQTANLYISTHRTLKAAESKVRSWTRKYPDSGIPPIWDIAMGKFV